ncbi:MAG: PAS domain-containing protein [Candidatus Omnitrophota bacterium]|jgi:serine/threonine-protein kinase RsbT|nr:MAG: PAS domain-containing protein [Candidatus Omnitrophota bacterium]
MEIYSQEIQDEKDIIATRDRARVICEELGFGITQQLQVATSVFELGKNILEHGGGGSISFSILTDGDSISLQAEGQDHGPGLTDSQIEELLKSGSSTTALRGVAAMKRLMDNIEIESELDKGTCIRLIKKKTQSTKNLARNIVSFLQQKFSSRKNPSLSEELRIQNLNLVQTLSLYEEKNQELEATNKELLDLKLQLEKSNAELQDRTSELQEALLSLGDRTTELEAHNRRFSAVLGQMSEGIVITDRSGVVTTANDQFCTMFDRENKNVVGLSKSEWYTILGKICAMQPDEWNKTCASLDQNPQTILTFGLTMIGKEKSALSCRTTPILDGETKLVGRLWIFE